MIPYCHNNFLQLYIRGTFLGLRQHLKVQFTRQCLPCFDDPTIWNKAMKFESKRCRVENIICFTNQSNSMAHAICRQRGKYVIWKSTCQRIGHGWHEGSWKRRGWQSPMCCPGPSGSQWSRELSPEQTVAPPSVHLYCDVCPYKVKHRWSQVVWIII